MQDVQKVLDYDKENWPEYEIISDKELPSKQTILLAWTTELRASGIHVLKWNMARLRDLYICIF